MELLHFLRSFNSAHSGILLSSNAVCVYLDLMEMKEQNPSRLDIGVKKMQIRKFSSRMTDIRLLN